MNVIPNDVIPIIFNYITKITDKRQFVRTCVNYNIVTKPLLQAYESIYSIKSFGKINDYCMEKFTLELCNNSYFDMIPISYMNTSNSVIIRAMIKYGNVKLLQNIINIACGLNINIFDVIVEKGYEGELEELRGNCYRFIRFISAVSAFTNNLEFIKWIPNRKYCHEGGANNSNIAFYAIAGGNLDVLLWALHSGGHEWKYYDKEDVIITAKVANLNIPNINNLTGCNWDKQTTATAALNGHIDVLKWLIKNGCSWDETVYINAMKNNHYKIAKWIMSMNDWKPLDEHTYPYIEIDGYLQ